MRVTPHYAIIDPETGQIDRRIFIDQAIYDEEMSKIFARAWLMIGHTSLVPHVNDFFHTYMGEDPVLLTRDAQGCLHAFLNMCRHRGNRIVRCDDGNAPRFMCTYHGWTYANDGTLEHVPGEAEAYYNALDKAARGLIEARVETYAGLVFATWAQDAPSLEAYLGDARWYLDTVFNRRDCGMQALGPLKWLEPVNWKTVVDNCSDNYHVPTSHMSSMLVQSRYLGRPLFTHEEQFRSPNKHVFVNGHALTFRAADDNTPRYVHGMSRETFAVFQEHYHATLPEVERRLGKLRAHNIQLGNHSLFPNSVLGFRLALPRGPQRTEFWHFVLLEQDAPEVVKHVIRTGSQANNGAAGLFEQDDIDNWRQVTLASRSPIARRYGQDLSMGVGHAGTHPDYPGLVSERYISEHNQRHFYLRWQEFMNATSWADIHLDPMTAHFEGTATMHG